MQISTQNSKPQISFIITTYNIDDEMLRSCIDSILRLSLSRDDREIILVDDGSDLPPLTSISDIIDEIIYIRQRNQGLSAARNRGLQIANGEYIQFVDGDDMLIQAPYEHCLDIARYHNPDMVIFDTSHSPTSEVAFEYNGPISGSEYMHSYFPPLYTPHFALYSWYSSRGRRVHSSTSFTCRTCVLYKGQGLLLSPAFTVYHA